MHQPNEKHPLTVHCTNSGVFGNEHKDALGELGINHKEVHREISLNGDALTIPGALLSRSRDETLVLLLKTGKFKPQPGDAERLARQTPPDEA